MTTIRRASLAVLAILAYPAGGATTGAGKSRV